LLVANAKENENESQDYGRRRLEASTLCHPKTALEVASLFLGRIMEQGPLGASYHQFGQI
jgi:hypothetical protein